MEAQLAGKLENLESLIERLGSVLVAFSGGVDSSLLLKVAVNVLGGNVLAVIADSPTYPPSELAEALDLARQIGANCLVAKTEELSDPRFSSNPPERCYHCKVELFGKLKAIARERNIKWVADGSNCDDLLDFRPGSRAAREHGIVSPLREAGLTKSEVRELARTVGLPNWSKPPQACLASRFPYGTEITRPELERVAAAEQSLKRQGFSQVRVRTHGDVARIEVLPDELDNLLSHEVRDLVVNDLRKLGFLFVTIDLEGYRTGSMNEPIRKIIGSELRG
ncbi:MAG: ATP-dependent sacrificial sulfur transferase LarE [Candidatus Eisenbacteria bacterium]|nr:ATP-dependent sacrificial sulfur transferase LarE [Candidatus Eisenbacteria bacterium]